MNKLLPWDLAIFLKKNAMHTGFQILRCTKFDIPNSSGKYQKPRIHLSLELDFYFGNSCDANKSTLYVPGYPYLVHSCASDVIWWMAKHYCQVRAGLGPRLQRHKCQVRAGLGPRLLWVNGAIWEQLRRAKPMSRCYAYKKNFEKILNCSSTYRNKLMSLV